LETVAINGAPAIKSVGPEFQSPSSLAVGRGIITARLVVAFPNLTFLRLDALGEWEEESKSETTEAMAMPALKKLTIDNCKLSCLPAGLASSRRHALRRLNLYELADLTSVENFHSVVELDVFDCPKLKRIRPYQVAEDKDHPLPQYGDPGRSPITGQHGDGGRHHGDTSRISESSNPMVSQPDLQQEVV
jgi:hypothetical protein